MQPGNQIYRGFVISWYDNHIALWWNSKVLIKNPISYKMEIDYFRFNILMSKYVRYVDILLDAVPNVTAGDAYSVDITYFGYQPDEKAYAQDDLHDNTVIIASPTAGIMERRYYLNDKVFSAVRDTKTGQIVEYSIN